MRRQHAGRPLVASIQLVGPADYGRSGSDRRGIPGRGRELTAAFPSPMAASTFPFTHRSWHRVDLIEARLAW